MAEAKNEPAGNKPDAPEVVAALTALARALSTLSVYGREHPLATQVLEQGHEALAGLFGARNKAVLGISEGRLALDGVPLNAATSLMKQLEKKLTDLKVTGLTLRKHLSLDEYCRLVTLLAEENSDNFSAELSGAGLSGVSASSARYQVVNDDEAVVAKTVLERRRRRQAMRQESLAEPAESAPSEAEAAAVNVQQVVAFLKGAPGASEAAAQEELEKAASDPRQLAQMIMEAAAIRQGTVGLVDGEGMSDIVFGFLRRTFDTLKKTSRFEGPSGRVNLKRSLMLLEKSIIEKMHKALGRPDPEMDRKIVEAVENFREELDVEQVASLYAEQRAAVQRSEKRIMSYIQSQGAVPARELMQSMGLDESDWRRMVVRSQHLQPQGKGGGPGDGSGAGADVAASMGTLAVVLEKLEGLMRQDVRSVEEVNQVIEQAHAQVAAAGARTDEKIDQLAGKLAKKEDGTIEGTSGRMKVAELITAISEIAQELAQPLTAINTSTEMLLQGFAGEVSSEQKDLLQLAKGSADNLHYLIDQLIEIVGFPINRGVDARYHRSATSDSD